MRIELQLVEFEHGTCAIIPVAGKPDRPTLINHLCISRFAITPTISQPENRTTNRILVPIKNDDGMRHNDTQWRVRDGQNVSTTAPSFPIPIAFAEPVTFQVPIIRQN